MPPKRLAWLALLGPLALWGLLELAAALWPATRGTTARALLIKGGLVVAISVLYGAILLISARRQDRLERQNRELVALRDAGLHIASELSLDVVLQKVVDQARALIGTRYGALAVYGEGGGIRHFITSGLDPAEAAKIAHPPVGNGLLGVVLQEGQCLRTADIGTEPHACGLPPNHPPLHSLVVVPVVCRGPFRGNLYLSERLDGQAFEQQDEETLLRFATQTAIAVDNAHLHAKVHGVAVLEERLRLSREIHDGQAQVLAYVNTKAQAVGELLRSGRGEEARQHLEQLAAAARETYTDVRESIFGLRSRVDDGNSLGQAIRGHVEQWQDQCEIPVDLVLEDLPRFSTDVELQLLRIVQEALANVRKHSGAEQARVAVRYQEGAIKISIEDDGQGFDPESPGRDHKPRFGLATMRERAQAIGAELGIQAPAGVGTRVALEYVPASEERR